MKTTNKKILRNAVMLIGLMTGLAAQATSIPLTNPSFESPVVGAWSSGFLPDGWSWDYGTYIQGPTGHSGNQCVVNLAEAGWFQLSQESTYTVQRAGEMITGQAWAKVSNLENGTADFQVVVDIGYVPVATNMLVVTTNMVSGQSLDWTNLTVTYISTDADIGQTVGVAIRSDGGASTNYSPSYCYMDDVSLDTASSGGPTVVATGTPNPVDLFSNVLITAEVTPGASPTITSVVLDASAIGGSSSVSLVSSNGTDIYTNTVAASYPVDYDVALTLPVTATDDNGLVGQTNILLVVNRPPLLTWGGGNGNWSDANWLPYYVTGPITGANRVAIVTNGMVTVDHPGGVGGLASIILDSSGVMEVGNAHYGSYGNILLTGGTLDTPDTVDNAYHAYGASILSAVSASDSGTSTISNSGGSSWFNLNYPTATFTVSNSATLTVSATLAGANDPANDNLFIASGLIKAGGGTLVLTGANTYAGVTTVTAGTLSLAGVGALQTNTALSVSSGAIVNLNYGGTIPLSSLVLNGVSQSGGTYGATGSGADHVNDTYFTGTGLVSVPGAAAPPTLVYTNLGTGQLQFSWSGTATLQVQTNSLGTGLGTNWVDYSSASPVTVQIDSANSSVFFRLKQ